MMSSAIWHGFFFGYYLFFLGMAIINEISKMAYRGKLHIIYKKMYEKLGKRMC